MEIIDQIVEEGEITVAVVLIIAIVFTILAVILVVTCVCVTFICVCTCTIKSMKSDNSEPVQYEMTEEGVKYNLPPPRFIDV